MFSWIILGLAVGILAHLLDSSSAKGGILGAMLLGVVGALVGGFLANLIFGYASTGLTLQSIFIAAISALTLLFIGRAIRAVD